MNDSKPNQIFIEDKHKFFSKPRDLKNLKQEIEETDRSVSETEYLFLLENQITLETEFLHLFAVLKKQKKEGNEAFWLYCYYSASLLETFYKAYSQETKEADFRRLKQQIKDRLESVSVKKEKDELFIQMVQRHLVAGFESIKKIPFHLSVLRDYVVAANMNRLYWVFCRITVSRALLLAKELQWIENLDALLGIHTDVNKIISFLEKPNPVLNYFSVGLFLMRFIIDVGLLLKHTFFLTDPKKQFKSTAYERFKYELYKRHCNFANDLVWASINFLTNFNKITGIPGPVANGLIAVFLGFDVCMALYKCFLAKQEYLVKRAEYDQQIQGYNDPLQFKELTPDGRKKYIDLLESQKVELQINWKTKEGTCYFVAAAASLLMLGFASALILNPAGLILLNCFICHFAISMYFSAGAYGSYKEKSLRLDQAKRCGADLVLPDKALECARRDFIYTLAKNAIIPMVLIATFALYWPAALALTALYVGYELFHSYDQHRRNKEIAACEAVATLGN